jgi:hypothetical protein
MLLMLQTKTCYLAALPGPQSDALRHQLQTKHVACLSIERTSPSAPNSTSVRSILNRSDFVSCILPRNPPANLIFELGIAIGLNKPLLLFADDPEQVPLDLASSSRALRSDLISSDALNPFLEAFLRTIVPSRAKRHTSASRKSLPANFWQEIRSKVSRIPSLPPPTAGSELEAIVKEAFQRAGFNLTSSPGPDFGADFALFSPSLNKTFGLPILVEVKNNSKSALRQSDVDKLSELLREKRGGAGLIVTYTDIEKQSPLRLGQPIVIVPAGELLEWLEAGSFADELAATIDMFWMRER